MKYTSGFQQQKRFDTFQIKRGKNNDFQFWLRVAK